MWGLPGPGLEPVSPALVGGFLTTVPPGKSEACVFIVVFNNFNLLYCYIVLLYKSLLLGLTFCFELMILLTKEI